MTQPSQSVATDRLTRIATVAARVSPAPWPLAVNHAEAIAAHWRQRVADNPAFYDGHVFVLRQLMISPPRVDAVFSLERFSAFLYLRDHPELDRDSLDGFCSAVIRSADGAVLVGRTSATTLNAGRLNVPGGFIDARDARPDGRIDIDASAARELAEETGLDVRSLERVPGYHVVRAGRLCSFAVTYRSPLDAETLRGVMLEGLARDSQRELSDIVILRDPDALDDLDLLPHARRLVRSALEENR